MEISKIETRKTGTGFLKLSKVGKTLVRLSKKIRETTWIKLEMIEDTLQLILHYYKDYNTPTKWIT